MKPKTLLLSLLFLPYLIWAIAIPFMALPTKSILQGIVIGFSIVYTFGIIFWGIPYTILIIGVLFWSRKRSAKEIYGILSQLPLGLALITVAELLVVFLYLGLNSEIRFSLLEDLGNLVVYSFTAMFTIFIYGYIFVFLSKGVYKVFEHLQWIKNEAGISQDTSSYSSESSTNNLKGSEN
jgi:glucan phosphoethanolaminetransferase (alkaline phosphatase superfamily)